MKVYLVYETNGVWSDTTWTPLKVFATLEAANRYCDDTLVKVKADEVRERAEAKAKDEDYYSYYDPTFHVAELDTDSEFDTMLIGRA